MLVNKTFKLILDTQTKRQHMKYPRVRLCQVRDRYPEFWKMVQPVEEIRPGPEGHLHPLNTVNSPPHFFRGYLGYEGIPFSPSTALLEMPPVGIQKLDIRLLPSVCNKA